MAKQKQKSNQFDQNLQNHIEQIGCKSIEGYQQWCAYNGFSRSLKKSRSSRKKELKFIEQRRSSARVRVKPRLAAIAMHADKWKRPLEDWKPRSHNVRRQFDSLVDHLFVLQPTPAFFFDVWFHMAPSAAMRRQEAFVHVAAGKNIRKTDLPLPYTKRMSHFFMQASNDLSYYEALRWGQILGLGGSPLLARALIGTRLSRSFDHDRFWSSVIKWFIDYPNRVTIQDRITDVAAIAGYKYGKARML